MVLVWIGQILLFFILWKLFHWGIGFLLQSMTGRSMVFDLVVNVAVAVLLLVFVRTLHSTWWLMGIIGALVGIITAMMAARGKATE